MPGDPGPLIARLASECRAGGLDLATSLQAGWYNESVAQPHRLPDFDDPASAVVLIGNTRRLWPRFLQSLRGRGDSLAHSDPLDRYVEQRVSAAVAGLGVPARIRWAHRPEPQHIAIQHLADVAGLAWRSPAALSIHPRYGPWIGLRAAVVLPMPGPPARPAALPGCDACASACVAALAAVAPGDWRSQLAVRDACPIGRDYRYSDAQIEYHYTKSPDLLRAAVRSSRAEP